MENTFKDKVVVVTGGAQGIGRCISEEFTKAGAHVCVIDKQEGNHYVGDISDKGTLEAFAADVIGKYGKVDVLVNNALPIMRGIDECSYEEFQYALSVGVTAPFYLAKLFSKHFTQGASICPAPTAHRHIARGIDTAVAQIAQQRADNVGLAHAGICTGNEIMAHDFLTAFIPGW